MTRFLLFSICFFLHAVSAQDRKVDSINKDVLQRYKTLIETTRRQQVLDSAERIRLQEKIAHLQESDRLEKNILEKQLNTLKTKDSIRLVEKKTAIETRKRAAVGYPVLGPAKDTLFLLYNTAGGFTANERAQAISQRIRKVGTQFDFNRDSLKARTHDRSADILNSRDLVMNISENDALWHDTTPAALADDYSNRIHQSVIKYQSDINFFTIARQVGFAALLLLGLILTMYGTSRFFRWTAGRLRDQEGKHITGIRFRNHELIDAHQQVLTLLGINFVLKWAVTIGMFVVVLPWFLSVFPWTRNFEHSVLGYIFNPLKNLAVAFWNYLPNLFTILVIIFVFRYVLLALRSLKREVELGRLRLPSFYKEWANPTYQILRILIFAFMIVVIFEYLPKSESPIFKGVSVFLGLLFTFGSAGSLSNLTSGIILTYMRLFQLGDHVKIGDAVGDVIEKSLLVIRLRTPNNEIISIPNSAVMTSQTINYSSEAERRGLILSTVVNVGYDIPWRKVYDALLEAADRCSYALKDPKPFALHTRLEDFYIAYEICIYTHEASAQAAVYSELHCHIQDTFCEAGIEIITPHYRSELPGKPTAGK